MGEYNWENNSPVRIETSHRWIKVKSPQNASEAELNYITTLTNAAENHLYLPDSYEAEDGYSWMDFYDVDSWVIQYLLQEISDNVDTELGSQFFYVKDHDVKLYGGPGWDFDRSGWIPAGNTDLFYATHSLHVMGLHSDTKQGLDKEYDFESNHVWLQQLDSHDPFHKRVKELYIQLFYPILKKILTEDYRVWQQQIRMSLRADCIRWNGRYGSFAEALDQADRLAEIFAGREAFLYDYYSNEDDYVVIRFHTMDNDYDSLNRYDLLVPVRKETCLGHELPIMNTSKEWYDEQGKLFSAATKITDNIVLNQRGKQ